MQTHDFPNPRPEQTTSISGTILKKRLDKGCVTFGQKRFSRYPTDLPDLLAIRWEKRPPESDRPSDTEHVEKTETAPAQTGTQHINSLRVFQVFTKQIFDIQPASQFLGRNFERAKA